MKPFKMNDPTPHATNSLLGVVLNGGKSTRMGRTKASLTLPDGHTFLEHAIHRFSGVCDKIVISSALNDQADTCKLAPIVCDVEDSNGPLSGIYACLNYAAANKYSACFFTPIDMPYLRSDNLQLVKQKWRRDSDRIACVENLSRATLEPLVAIIPTILTKSIEYQLQIGERSVYRWMEHQELNRIPLDSTLLRNINQPDDYQATRN